MSKAVVLSLRTQYENVGDLFIILASVKYLLQSYKDVILDAKGVPEYYVKEVDSLVGIFYPSKNFSVTNVSLPDYLFKEFDYYLKPGGYSSSNGIKASLVNILRLGIVSWRRLLSLGKTYSFPISFSGPLSFTDSLFFKSCDGVSLRDVESLKYFEDTGVDKVYLMKDMSHYLSKEFSKLSSSYPATKTSKRRLNDVVFSFRYDRCPSIDTLQKVIQVLASKNVTVVSQVAFDDKLTEEISKQLCCNALICKPNLDGLKKLSSIYNETDFVISNRLHVLLLALFCGATPVPILCKGDVKVQNYFKQLGFKTVFEGCDSFEQSFRDCVKLNQTQKNIDLDIDILLSGLNEMRE